MKLAVKVSASVHGAHGQLGELPEQCLRSKFASNQMCCITEKASETKSCHIFPGFEIWHQN